MDIYSWALVKEFQTLLSGVLAIVAAFLTAIIIYRSARLPVSAKKKADEQRNECRVKTASIELFEDTRRLNQQAKSISSRIRAIAAGRKAVTDEDRWKLQLFIPEVIQDRELLALFPNDVVTACIRLAGEVRRHGHDMARVGTFESDAFRKEVLRRLNDIGAAAFEISNALNVESFKS